MKITSQYINELLVKEDIEGLIALGAPLDEYESEAKIIADAISELDRSQFNEENLIAIITLAWASFELSGEELQLRLPHIQNVAQEIVKRD